MNTTDAARRRLEDALAERFGQPVAADPGLPHIEALANFALHSSHRKFAERPVDPELVRLAAALALSSPSKSDLQQADIVEVANPETRRIIAELVPDMPWVGAAPVFLVFCGNNRRTRQIGEWRGKPFANDHLDAFFNAAVDAGIALSAFIRAASLVGLGTCPISVIRNHADRVSRLLGLPDHVFPVAGLCLGWPVYGGRVVHRLPLEVTLHRDRFSEEGLRQHIDRYDQRRAAKHPYAEQRSVERHGQASFYGWSEDKARQYSQPERADFGAFVRAKGFRLD